MAEQNEVGGREKGRKPDKEKVQMEGLLTCR